MLKKFFSKKSYIALLELSILKNAYKVDEPMDNFYSYLLQLQFLKTLSVNFKVHLEPLKE